MPEPERVIITGWEASGSTFVFQLAKLLGLDVLHTHGKWEALRMDRVIFTIRDPRDVICSHARRHYSEGWKAGRYEEALLKSLDEFLASHYVEDLFKSLMQPNVIIIRYETFFGCHEEVLLRMLADQFIIPLDDRKVMSFLEETSLEANQKRSERFCGFQKYDEETRIHGLHITNKGRPGAWKRWFTPAVDEAVKQKLGNVLVHLGYEKDTNWSSMDTTDNSSYPPDSLNLQGNE
jgi:hypothetical protein